MLSKVEDVVLYKDEKYYSSFPAAVTLADGTVLVLFRRAPDPRWLLDPADAGSLADWVSHTHERSHQALIRLDGASLRPLSEAEALPLNPLAADQDASLLLAANGRLLLGSFCWYGMPPAFAETLRARGFGLHGSVEHDGMLYGFFGGLTRTSDDGGRTWSAHNYLPSLPGMSDFVPGKWPRYGGAVRGKPVESDGEILLPVYTTPVDDPCSVAYCYASQDGGLNWEYRSVVARDAERRVHMHEPAFHRCPSGKIVCFIRTANLEDHLVTTESLDNGHTWSPWRQQDVIGHPYNSVALPGGGVLLVYGYRHQPFGIRARILDDECTDFTGPELVLRDDGRSFDLGYPWATLLPDGRVLVAYYRYDADGVRYIAGAVLAQS